MTFAIMMPTKNRVNYLRATLDNMLKMKLPKEIQLHVFDNSDDKSIFFEDKYKPLNIVVHKANSPNVYAVLFQAVEFMSKNFDWFFYTDDDILYHPDTFTVCEYISKQEITHTSYLFNDKKEIINKELKKDKLGQIVPSNTMIEIWMGENVGIRRAFGAGRSYNNSMMIKEAIEEFKPDLSNNLFDQLSEKIGHHYKDWLYFGLKDDYTFHFGVEGLHSGVRKDVEAWLPHFIGDKEEAKRCLELVP